MKTSLTSGLIVLALSLASTAWAQCDKPKATAGGDTARTAGQKDSSGCAAKCAAGKADCCQEGCPGKAALATGMPLMKYKLGDQVLCCPEKARKAADGQEASLRYVVGETEYNDQAEALKAYQTVLETHLERMTTVQYAVGDKCVGCPSAAQALARECGDPVKFRVASFTFGDRTEADRAAKAAHAAAEKVTMKQVVDGKEYTCAESAKRSCGAQVADGENKKDCEYQVGDLKTRCKINASVELAKARIQAAHQAIAEVAGQPAERKEVAAGV